MNCGVEGVMECGNFSVVYEGKRGAMKHVIASKTWASDEWEGGKKVKALNYCLVTCQ